MKGHRGTNATPGRKAKSNGREARRGARGLALGRGNDGADRLGVAIFELGAGPRVRIALLSSIGAEAEWVNLTAGAPERALGVQL
jgi:hypothetical protein